MTIWTDLLGASVYYVDVGGVRTRCIEAGSGDVLILLHGGGGHSEAYSRNVIPLGEHFHVYAVDMPGHGLTDPHPTTPGVRGAAAHLAQFMDLFDIDSAYLAGESMGGSVAALVALEHPRRAKKVAFITGAGLHMGEDVDRLAEPGRAEMRRLSAAARGNPTPESVHARLSWLFADPERSVTEELVEVRYRLYSMLAQKDTTARDTNAGGQRAEDVIWNGERLRQITVPFLFLWTDHNPTPLPVAEKAHREMPGSELHVIRNAGHWPQYEQPDEFNRTITEFFTR